LPLFSGQGPAFHADRDGSGNPVNFAWFGNAPDASLGLSTDTLTHKESYTGNRTTDARIITELTATIAITVDDFKEANFAVASYGTAAAISGGAITGEAVLTAAPVVGERYALKATGVDASGVIVFSDVAAMTGPITADYTNAASRQVGVFKTAPPEKHIRIDGYNTARTVSGDFERVVMDAFKCRLDPLETLGMINDEFGTMVINGSVLVDTTKAAASATGQFMRLIYFDA
jgi:hypothetical protein